MPAFDVFDSSETAETTFGSYADLDTADKIYHIVSGEDNSNLNGHYHQYDGNWFKTTVVNKEDANAPAVKAALILAAQGILLKETVEAILP